MTTEFNPEDFYNESFDGIYDKKILIEGDSWVSHPQMTNLAGHFDKYDPNNLILNLGSPGDNAGSQYGNSDAVFRAGGPQMKQLKKLINTLQWGEKFDLIFISAAGNDVIGPEIREIPLVNNKRDFPGAYGRDLINPNFYVKMSKVIDGYRRFLKMIRANDLNKNTPIITHAYAYLKPRPVGTHFFDVQFNRGWINQHLSHQGIKDEDEQYEIVIEIFDRYYQRISPLQNEFKKFLVVDTRKTLLKNGVPDTSLFHDEIHPTTAGFRKVFNKIKSEAKKANLWTI